MFTLITMLVTAVFCVGRTVAYKDLPSYMLMNNIVTSLCKWDAGTAGSGQSAAVYGLVEDVYKMVIPIALSLALCYAILDLINSVTRTGVENVTASVIIVPLLRFAACWLLMKYGLKIVGLIMGSSNFLVDQIQGKLTSDLTSDAQTKEMISPAETAGMLSRLVFEVLPSLLAIIGQTIAGIVLAFQVISIRIEFLIRASFLPLAISSVAQGGANSAGMRYIKKLLSNMFMMMGIVVTIELTFLLLSTANISLEIFPGDGTIAETANRFLGAMFQGLVGPFAAVGCVGAFKSALNDAFN